jgi:SM-20-related protein
MDIAKAVDDLKTQEYFIWDDFLSPSETAQVAEDYRKIYASGRFTRAGTGNESGVRVVNEKFRTDETFWLNPLDLSAIQTCFWDRLEVLKNQINEQLFLGLWSFDGHYSHYPVNGHYQKHLDRFNSNDQRTLSMVFYLNKDWVSEDGGELRLHFPARTPNTVDVAPLAGRLVCFLSSEVLHEVLITHKTRESFAGWWKRRGPRLV